MMIKNNLKKIALVAAFALAGAGAWGQSSAKAIPVTEYDATVFDKADTLTRKEIRRISARIVFLGGSYRLEVTKAKGDYSGYSLGFKTTGDWMTYVPAQATATVDRYPAAPAALKTVLNAANVAPPDGEKSWKLDKVYSVPTDGYLAATVSSASVTLLGSGTAMFNTMTTATVSIPLPGSEVAFGETTFIVLMKYSGGVDAIVIKRINEYWNGEYAFFGSTSVDYTKKALGLLALQFQEGTKTEYMKTVPVAFGLGVNELETVWSGKDANAKATAVMAMSSVLANGLMQAVAWDAGYPLFDQNAMGDGIADSFEALYGKTRNTYLRAYLTATCHLGVPPLYGITAAKSGAYAWSQYASIRDVQGAQIAAAAMRYATWGVEYTPQERTYAAGIPALRPFAHIYEANKTTIDAWIGAASNDGVSKNDFVKTVQKALSGISAEDFTTGTLVALPSFMINDKAWYTSYYSPYDGGASGLPLPYAAGGVDTPRTFAYKMVKQLDARNTIHATMIKTLFGVVPSGPSHLKVKLYKDPAFDNYVTVRELELWGAAKQGDSYLYTRTPDAPTPLKPFLPGGTTVSPLNAGVDTLGFLTGCIAMTNFSELVKGYGDEPKSSTLATSYEQPCNPSATASPAFERFSLADLERMSVIVPDLSALQKGDILVRKGKVEGVAELGFVVHLPAVTAAMQADWSLLLNEVIVVTVRPAFRQATLGTWGNRGMSFGGFTTDPKGFMVRRLLIDSGAPYVAKNPNAIDPAWNLTSPVIDPAASTFRIAAMYEHTRVIPEGEDRSSLRERWIPNTGEYLRLNAYVTMRNASGAAIDPTVFFPDGVKVVLGAIDRNYNDVSAADSNITKNIGAGFSLAGGFDNWTSFVTDIDILARTTAGNEAEKRIYTNTGGGAFWLASSGHVVAKKDEAIGITCIRPLPATSATDWIHPGDDILLTASLSTDSGIQITDAPISSLEPDYLAVYDKKMLWRANLYIDETQAETRDAAGVVTQARVVDWNDLHPWNAPADSAKKVRKNALDVNDSEVATVSPWWGEAWGYNEWNRKFSLGQPFTGVATVGLDNLPVGDGTQTVELLSFTPIRSLKSPSGVEKATNIISGTVAYSYPKHGYEAAAAWTPQIEVKGLRQAGDPAWGFSTTGDPGSMDSPFDFIWKMRKTVGVLDDEIGASPNTYSWWDYDVTKPVGTIGTTTLQPSMFRYVPSLGLYLNTPWHETNEGYSASPNTIASIADDPDTWFVQTGALDYTSGETTYQIVYLDGADTHQMRRNASWIIEAGTDCIGFAQRAASWRYKDSDASADQAPYAWKRMPRGVMEYNLGAGTENPYDTFVAYGMDLVGYRKYPIADTTESDIVSHRRVKKVVNGVLTDSNDAPPSIEELRRVVPGDIWVKDSASLMETETKDHIAIVAYVPPNAMELDVDKLMEQILLIEGEYTNKIQSVIKKLSVGDYNHNNLLSDKTIYPGYVWKKDQVGLSLNCQSWAIRRLK